MKYFRILPIAFMLITNLIVYTDENANYRGNLAISFDITRYESSFETENDRQIHDMNNLAYSGIGVLVGGVLTSGTCTPLFVIGYIDYLSDSVGYSKMKPYSLGFYIGGLAGMIIGDIMILAGISMIVIGFSAIKYLKQESPDTDISSFSDFDSGSLRTGIRIKFR
jgi:hypothetical protein